MNLIKEKQQQVFFDFGQIKDQDDRYRYLIKKAKSTNPLNDEDKLDKFLIEGCVSQAWLIPSIDNKIISFKFDSDALLVKGILAMLVELFNGLSPQELLDLDMSFLADIGISEHLSMNRRNGLASIIKQSKLYALVYNSL